MTDDLQNRVVVRARSWIGTPYRHQASLRGVGTDCLGLVRGLWRELYVREPELPPAYTQDWAETSGEEVLWSAALRHMIERDPADAEPGDVILFRMRRSAIAKHMGILGKPFPAPSFIHAYSGHGVVESALTLPWQRRVVAAFSFPEGVE